MQDLTKKYSYHILGYNFCINYPLALRQIQLPKTAHKIYLKIELTSHKESKHTQVRKNLYKVCLPNHLSHRERQSLIANQIIPQIISFHGEWVMHASGIGLCGKAIVFAGLSGSGKSTLARNLSVHDTLYMGDESIRVTVIRNRNIVYPSTPELRINSNSPNTKSVFGKNSLSLKNKFQSKPIELGAIILLKKTPSTTKLRLQRLSTEATFKKLLMNSHTVNARKKRLLKTHFLKMTKVLMDAQVWQLALPHNHKNLSAQIKRLLQKNILLD